MSDEKKQHEVDELFAFWKWAVETRNDLEARVARWTDFAHPRNEKLRDEIRQSYSPERVQSQLDSFHHYWDDAKESELEKAQDDLSRFLFGPIGVSSRRNRIGRDGMHGLYKRPPSLSFREAWEARGRYVLQRNAVRELGRYLELRVEPTHETKESDSLWASLLDFARSILEDEPEHEKQKRRAETALGALLIGSHDQPIPELVQTVHGLVATAHEQPPAEISKVRIGRDLRIALGIIARLEGVEPSTLAKRL